MASISWITSLVVALVLLILPADTSHPGCPSICLCKWKSGKQTVECTDQGLTTIPSGIQNSVQVIDLSGNNLQLLPNKVFHLNGLTHLQKIYLSRCYLKEIANDAFFQVTNLVELYLTGNLLREIPAQTFKDIPLLRRLQLSKNPIQRIVNGTFSNLPQLTILELSNCEINTIEPDAFRDLNNLEFLKLDNNQIRTLSIEVVRPLTRLYGINLQNNPWYCDCYLRGLREWMMMKNVPFNVPPKCELPEHVRDKTWDVLELDDFSCPPIIHSEEDVHVDRQQNGTLQCEVKSTPEALVTWMVNGVDINNGSILPSWNDKYWIEEEINDDDSKNIKLTVIRVAEEDSGVYSCIATNSAGTTATNITLFVVLPEPPVVGWSKAQIAGFVVGMMLFIILVVVLVCIMTLRRKALSATDSKLNGMGFLKHLAYVKQNSIEVKGEKEITINDKHPRRETGSSGYGSDQQTPDLVSRAMEMEGPSPPNPSNHVDSEDNWSMEKLKCNEVEWLNNRAGHYVSSSPSYVPRYINEVEYTERKNIDPGDTGSFRDESYHSYTSPAHSNWKRSPLVLPNNVYLSLSHDMCCSPDEGYDEGALEGTEV